MKREMWRCLVRRFCMRGTWEISQSLVFFIQMYDLRVIYLFVFVLGFIFR